MRHVFLQLLELHQRLTLDLPELCLCPLRLLLDLPELCLCDNQEGAEEYEKEQEEHALKRQLQSGELHRWTTEAARVALAVSLATTEEATKSHEMRQELSYCPQQGVSRFPQMRIAAVVSGRMLRPAGLRARCAGRKKIDVVFSRGGPATVGSEEKAREVVRAGGLRGGKAHWRA